jgi:hypothetical protein
MSYIIQNGVVYCVGNQIKGASSMDMSLLAPSYSPSSTYSSGDYVSKDDAFYKCVEDISSPEDWTPSHWSATTIADELSEVFDDVPKDVYIYYGGQTLSNFPDAVIAQYAHNEDTADFDDPSFESMRLVDVTLPFAKSIGTCAFKQCERLSAISVPKVESIGNSAFANCSALATVTLPACASIGTEAFADCWSLTTVYLTGNSVTELASTNAFMSTPIEASSYTGAFGSIFVPESLVDTYKAATNWSAYSDRITAYAP